MQGSHDLADGVFALGQAEGLADSDTDGGSDLERPRRFLHALKICLTFIRFPSKSYVILELFFTMAITFSSRCLIWTI